jgi:hypothetical protein
MALVLKDRVKETSTTTGTSTLTLLGAETGYQSFAVIGDGNTCYYTIQNTQSGSENEWEVGIGTYTASGTTLSRDAVFSSSNGGMLVNFTSGSKIVFVTYPAEKAFALDDTAPALSVNNVPFVAADGYLTNTNDFQYSQALNQAKAPVFYSVNGISVYSTVISYNYTLPADTFAVSFSPLAVANGISVTVPSGQTWTTAVNPYV